MTDGRADRVDLRLAPSALAAWAAALVALTCAPRLAWSVTGTLVLAAGALLSLEVRGERRTLTGRTAGGRVAPAGTPTVRASAALALLAAAGVLGAGTAHVAVQHRGLLPELAAVQGFAEVVGRVTAEPTTLPPSWPGAPARVRVLVEAVRVEGGGRAGRSRATVVVVGPSSWSQVQVGARVRGAGRLVPTSGGRAVALLTVTGAPRPVAPPPAWDRWANGLRARVVGLAQRLPPDARGLLPGVSVGDTRQVPDDLTAALRASGLTHVTAVSGAHFTLVAGLVLVVATATRLPRAPRAGVVVASMAALVVLVHPSPSVLRAAVMGLVGVLGLLAGRPARAPAALAACVVVLLVADPWLAVELGFVLSTLATAGLVLVAGPLAERWSRRLGRTLATGLAVPVAAQVTCAPAVLLVSSNVAPLAVVANVVVAPAVAPATVLGLGAGLLDGVWPAAAQVLTWPAGAACWWIAAVARAVAAVPASQVAWTGGPVGVLLLAVAGLGLVRVAMSGGRARSGPSVVSGTLDTCLLPPAAPPPDRPGPPPASPGRT